MKVSIIIPVYNEAGTLATLLDRVWRQPIAPATKEIVIVESNSTDGSREIVEAFAALRSGDSTVVRVVYQNAPRGKGHAVRAGFAVASGDILLIQDADLEYDVADYPQLIQPILEGRTAFVIGSRHLGADSWKIRNFARGDLRALLMNVGGVLFHRFFNAVFHSRLTDPTSMYKVLRADCLKRVNLSCNGFDLDFELTGKMIRAGYSPLEVPVAYRSRGFNQGKKIRLLCDPPTWIMAILRGRFAPKPRDSAAPAAPESAGYSEKPATRASS
jgi:glycosyltransferase involved in cell wall biosynthesis